MVDMYSKCTITETGAEISTSSENMVATLALEPTTYG
jgi:hypothetical protein